MADLKWLKSSFSEASGNNCVEVAPTEHGCVALRDSTRPTRTTSTNTVAFRAFIRGVKAGPFAPPR